MHFLSTFLVLAGRARGGCWFFELSVLRVREGVTPTTGIPVARISANPAGPRAAPRCAFAAPASQAPPPRPTPPPPFRHGAYWGFPWFSLQIRGRTPRCVGSAPRASGPHTSKGLPVAAVWTTERGGFFCVKPFPAFCPSLGEVQSLPELCRNLNLWPRPFYSPGSGCVSPGHTSQASVPVRGPALSYSLQHLGQCRTRRKDLMLTKC